MNTFCAVLRARIARAVRVKANVDGFGSTLAGAYWHVFFFVDFISCL